MPPSQILGFLAASRQKRHVAAVARNPRRPALRCSPLSSPRGSELPLPRHSAERKCPETANPPGCRPGEPQPGDSPSSVSRLLPLLSHRVLVAAPSEAEGVGTPHAWARGHKAARQGQGHQSLTHTNHPERRSPGRQPSSSRETTSRRREGLQVSPPWARVPVLPLAQPGLQAVPWLPHRQSRDNEAAHVSEKLRVWQRAARGEQSPRGPSGWSVADRASPAAGTTKTLGRRAGGWRASGARPLDVGRGSPLSS